MDMIQVTINGRKIDCEKGTTLYELAKEYGSSCGRDIITAKVDGVVKELASDLHEDCEVRFCTYAEDEGKKAYVRVITMIMLKAF